MAATLGPSDPLPQNLPPRSQPLQISSSLKPFFRHPPLSPPLSEPLASLSYSLSPEDPHLPTQTLTSPLRPSPPLSDPHLPPQTLTSSLRPSPPPSDHLLPSWTCLPPSYPPPSDSFILPPPSDSEPAASSLSAPLSPLWAESRHPLPSPVWAQSHCSSCSKGAGAWEDLGRPSNPTSWGHHLDKPRFSQAQLLSVQRGSALHPIPPLCWRVTRGEG